jgi:hypothetical protein
MQNVTDGQRAMTTRTGPDGKPTLTDLEQEFPGWVCWDDADGQSYARRPETPDGDHDARGEDPLDLRDAIILALEPDKEKTGTRPGNRAEPAQAGPSGQPG